MVAPITAQGSYGNATVTGSNFAKTVTNVGTFADLHNIVSDINDLDNQGIKNDRQQVISPPASGGTFTMLSNVDSVIIYSASGANITGTLNLSFPLTPTIGQAFKLCFVSAVTTLALTLPSNYTTSASTPTSAAANTALKYQLMNGSNGPLWISQ